MLYIYLSLIWAFSWGRFWCFECHLWWLQQKQSSHKCCESIIQYCYRLERFFFSFSTFSTLPPAFQPPLCCTVSALEIEISSPNCGKIVSQESELLSSHLFHFSHHSWHDKWAARECLSLSLLMAAPLSGVSLSSRRVSFLIHPPLSSTSSTKWLNYIPLRDFQSFHLPLSLMHSLTHYV